MKDAYSIGIEEEYFLVDAEHQAGDARNAEGPFWTSPRRPPTGR